MLSITVKVYVPGARPVYVAVVPVPDIDVFPTDSITSHVPEDGNPLSDTDPVATEQVG